MRQKEGQVSCIFRKKIFMLIFSNSNLSFSVNVSQYMLAKQVAKSAMLVGNFTVSNMAFSPMGKCRYQRKGYVEMIPFLRSLLKLEMENTYLEVFLLISNLQSLTRSAQGRIVSSFTQSS